MSKECEHIYGIWDNETSVIGRCIWITNPDLSWLNDPDTERFKYCPECGAKLVEEKQCL